MDTRNRRCLRKLSLAALTTLAIYFPAYAADLLIAVPNGPSTTLATAPAALQLYCANAVAKASGVDSAKLLPVSLQQDRLQDL